MLTTLKVLIIDDEVLIAEHLKSIIQSFGCLNIRLAHTPATAITIIETYKPDIVLLDIRLEEKQEGIEIGKRISQEFNIPFIYITAFSDSTIINTALKTHPASFITKPYKSSDIFAALNLVYINNPNLSKVYINFKYNHEYIRLATSEIHLVEREGNYIKIHSTTKKYLLRNSIEWVLEKLPVNTFLRVHRSYVINLGSIDKHTAEFVEVQNVQIPISRKTKDILIEMIASL